MGLIVDLSRQAEESLAAEAARRGIPAPEYARMLIERQLPAARAKGAHSAGTPRGRGKFAHIPVSSASFISKKQEEIEREDRGWRPAPST